ncbi:MAG: PAS domain S-box protein [Methanomicrobiales archaeon]|nr:PAS domain S-box protein [Methanomicrobiales archaeon]
MDNRQETIKKIKTLLRSHRKGLTITEIAQKLLLNRNSAAKYLEILLISGDVNLDTYGPAKVYTISQRMPVSALVKFSTDLIILIDSEMRVLDANENALLILGLSREDLAGNRIEKIKSPLIERLAIPDVFDEIQRSGEIIREFSITSNNEEHHYRVRLIPTVFDNQEEGLTVIGEDITKQIRFEQFLMVSEARYRGIVQDQTDFICRGSPDGTVTFINEPLAQFIGISCSDVCGKSFFPYIFPEDLPLAMEKMAGLTPDQSTNTIEIRVINRDGTFRWNIWSSRGIFDNTGTLVEWQSVGRDITERKQIEETLTRIRKAVDSSSEAIGIATPDGSHIYQNPAFTTMFGYSPEELSGPLGPVVLYADTRKGHEVFDTIMQGNSCNGEITMVSKRGHKFEVNFHADAIRDDIGEIIGLIGIHTDITERKRVEKALSESELLYRTILDNIQDVYYRADPEGMIVMISPSAQKLLGYDSLDEIIGENIAEKFYFYPEERENFLKTLYKQQKISDYEITLKKPDGSPVEISTNSQLLFDSEGHVTGIEGFFRDITFRKNAEKAIHESEERYRNVVEDQTEFICRFTPDGTHVFVNEAYCRYFGLEKEVVIGTRFRPVIHPDDREIIARLFSSLTPEHPVEVIDQRTIMPDGSTRWQRWADRAIFQLDGCLIEYQSVGRDITATKQDEEALRESEERFRTLLERVHSVAVQGYLPDYTVVYWNEASTRMYGYTAAEAIGKDIRELLVPVQARDAVTTAIARMAETGIPEPSAELELLHKDGSIVPVFSSHAVVKIPGRSTVQFCFDVDLSDRKKAEKAIRESEERYRNVVEDQTEFICRFTPDGTFVFVNEAYCRYFEMKREEIIGTRFQPVVHPEDRKKVARLFASLTLEHPVGVIDQRTIMPDGSTRWQRWADRAIFQLDGCLIEYQSVGRDITERRQLEENGVAALKRARDQQKALGTIAFSPYLFSGDVPGLSASLTEVSSGVLGVERVSIWLFNCNQDELRCIDLYEAPCNRHSSGDVLERHEYVPEFDALSKALYIDADDPLTDPRTAGYVDGYLKPNRITSMLDTVIRVTGQNLGVICFEHVDRPHHWDSDEITFACQLADQVAITLMNHDRRQAELALLESENRYRNVVEDQTEFICRFTPDGKITFCNNAYCRYFGLQKENCIGGPHSVVLPPKDAAVMRAHLASLTPKNPVKLVEHRILMPDGNLVWHCWSDRAIFGPGGEVIEYQSVGRDITKKMERAEKIRTSEERFHMIANLSPFPISIMDDASNYRYLNARFERLFGYTLADIPTGKDWFLKAFPDDIERHEAISTWKNDLAHSSTETARSRVYPVTCKDGTIRQVRFFAVTLANGEQFVVYEDLTPKNELDRLRSVLASIVDSSNDAIIGKTIDGTIISWNNAAERIYGYRADEIIGKSIGVIISPELRDQLPFFLERVRNGERIEHFRTKRVRKDGTPVAVSITLSPIRDENGGISGISTIARNISDTSEFDFRRTS